MVLPLDDGAIDSLFVGKRQDNEGEICPCLSSLSNVSKKKANHEWVKTTMCIYHQDKSSWLYSSFSSFFQVVVQKESNAICMKNAIYSCKRSDICKKPETDFA